MNLTVQIDGDDHAVVPLKDGDDHFNHEAERGALDRAYEAKESNPEATVSIVVNTAEGNRHVYMDARFDVTDLSHDERAALAGEVYAQAEASKTGDPEFPGHPDVEVEIEWNEVEQ